MKNLQKIIVIVVIILIVILTVIISSILMLKNNIIVNNNNASQNWSNNNTIIQNENMGNSDSENVQNITNFTISEDEMVEEIKYDILQDVTNPTYFYTVQRCLETHFEDMDSLKEKSNDTDKQKIYDQLSRKYIKENKITLNNIEDYVKQYSNKSFSNIEKMMQFQIEGNNIMRFVAKALFYDENKNIYYSNFIVYLDYINLTYFIQPVSDEITDISQVTLKDDVEIIEENKNNKYNYEVVTTEELLNKYIDFFIEKCLNKPQIAYGYLDEEYKNKFFNNLEEFKEFVTLNQNKIKAIKINSYKATYNDNYTEYTCLDVSRNTHKIIEKAVMQFKIILDDN